MTSRPWENPHQKSLKKNWAPLMPKRRVARIHQVAWVVLQETHLESIKQGCSVVCCVQSTFLVFIVSCRAEPIIGSLLVWWRLVFKRSWLLLYLNLLGMVCLSAVHETIACDDTSMSPSTHYFTPRVSKTGLLSSMICLWLRPVCDRLGIRLFLVFFDTNVNRIFVH